MLYRLSYKANASAGVEPATLINHCCLRRSQCAVSFKISNRRAAFFSIREAEDEGLLTQVEDDNEAHGKKGKRILLIFNGTVH